MNHFFKKVFILIVLASAFSRMLSAQVTIGSDKPAVKGALLDLKEEEVTGSVKNSDRGLLLPRVKLTDKNNLYPMFSSTSTDYQGTEKKAAQDKLHLGLMVFHTDLCTLQGAGVYIWTINGWDRLGGTRTVGGLASTPDEIFMYNKLSGSVDSQPLVVSWTPSTLAPPKLGSITGPLVYTVTPSEITDTRTSPVTLLLRATPFTADEITLVETTDATLAKNGNPFLRKKGSLALSLAGSPCATPAGGTQTNTVPVNLINKTIYLKNNPIYTNSTTKVGTTAIRSNAHWSVSQILSAGETPPTLTLSGTGITGTIPLALGTEVNWEGNDGLAAGTGSGTLTASVSGGASTSRYNYIYLTDMSSPQRFQDIILTVLQCESDKSLTMVKWAGLAGFPNVPESSGNNSADIAAGRDIPNSTTGIAWHRDQDGNVFLSSAFGTQTNGKERRWMITNLAAKTFAPVPRPDTTIQYISYLERIKMVVRLTYHGMA